MSPAARAADVSRIVGTEAARPGDASDALDGVVPGVVVTPSTPEAVAATLAWAQSEGLSVVVAGARTKDAWGRPPSRIDVVLSLARLNRVLAHEALDLTATVEAGASLGVVTSTLAARGQWLPLDPPFAASATIGGLVATNDSGPHRHRFGTPRDLILGVTLATVDGALSSAGGRVVKNVAGYDLGKLVCGSHGQLAVVVSATFKLAPIAQTSATVVVAADVTSLAHVTRTMTERQLEPTAVDLELDGDGAPAGTRLLVRFESVPPAVDAAVAEMTTLARDGGTSATIVRAADEAGLWQRHAERPWRPGSAVVRASWLPADLPRIVEALGATAGVCPLALAAQVGVGSGLITLEGDVERQAAAIVSLRELPFVGNVVVRSGARELRSRVDVWGPENATRRVGTAIKRAWDPHGILGAGRGPL